MKTVPNIINPAFALFAFACFAFLPEAQGQLSPPPGGGYPKLTTAEGCDALSTYLSDCIRFRSGGTYDTTIGGSNNVATADLDGDSNLDFVVPGYLGSVAVFYGNGAGSFSGPAIFPAGQLPVDVAVGDFNGDQLPDLAVADGAGAQVLLNNGDGTFAAPVFYPTRGGADLITTVDFDRDGDLDLALAAGSHLNVLLGNGDGTFQPTITSRGPDNPAGITVGDFNEDHKWDLAISNYNSRDLRILLGDGRGHFRIAFTYSLSDRGNPDEVVRGDFNRDGHDDLAVSVYNEFPNDHISVYFGNGDGSFTAGPEIPVIDPQGIVAADFNSDGNLDLAVTTYLQHDLVVALGDGLGNFPTVRSFHAPEAGGALDLAVADFDRNGKSDIVTTDPNGRVGIFLNVPCH
jgi:FG-GAP-like repeat